jgi:hypothetical protein
MHTHIMEYYSAFKKKEILQYFNSINTPENFMLSKIRQSHKDKKIMNSIYTRYLKCSNA